MGIALRDLECMYMCPLPLCFSQSTKAEGAQMRKIDRVQFQKIDVLCKSGSVALVAEASALAVVCHPIREVLDDNIL